MCGDERRVVGDGMRWAKVCGGLGCVVGESV